MLKQIALAAAAFMIALPAPAAQALEGPWRVGQSYVINVENAELDTAEGREALLYAVNRAARGLCRDALTRIDRRRCEMDAVAQVELRVSTAARTAIRLARAEAAGERQMAAR